MTTAPPPTPDDAIEAARTAAARVEELEAETSTARDVYYAAVAAAVDAVRDANLPAAQTHVAERLGISRQRVSELAARTPAHA